MGAGEILIIPQAFLRTELYTFFFPHFYLICETIKGFHNGGFLLLKLAQIFIYTRKRYKNTT